MEKKAIYAAMNRVKKALAAHGGITKDRNAPMGYSFRGIDDMFNVLCGLTAEAGIVMIPRVVESRIDYGQTAKGGAQTHVHCTMEVDYCSEEDGSVHTGRFLGEAIDTGDKAANKAMASAFKYAHLHPFQIPTHGESDDTEAYNVQVAPPPPPPPSPLPNMPPPIADSPPAAKKERKAREPKVTTGTLNVPTALVEFPDTAGLPPLVEAAPDGTLEAAVRQTNSFGILLQYAEEANPTREPQRSMVFDEIRRRAVELMTAADTVKDLAEAKPLIVALGSPSTLTSVYNANYARLRQTVVS